MIAARFIRCATAIVIACLACMPLGLVAAASDVAPVDYHTLSRGSRGVDVRALQYLLKHHGHSVGVDGAFGPGTETAVKSFQTAKGLTSDGVVGPASWVKLVVTTSQGASGDRVLALTTLLAKKDNGAVTSNFNAAVKTRVQTFQSHMGISADGVVGPSTWKYLVFHYEQPAPFLVICKGLQNGQDTANYAQEAWGTAQTTGFLEWAGNSIYTYYYPQRVAFRDLSKEHGGTFHDGQHNSHRYGMDIDIRPMSAVSGSPQYHCDLPAANPTLEYWDPQYSYTKTHFLALQVRAASTTLGRDLHKVTYFNDPNVIAALPEVQSLANHDEHLHARFCTAYFSYSSSYDC